MTNRPTGIAILAILLILGGLMNILGFTSNLLLYGILYGVLYLVLGIVNLIIGISLWGMKPWSRVAAIITQIISLLLSIGMLLFIGMLIPILMMFLLIGMIPGLVIALIVIGYLMQGSIKDAFEHQGAADAW